MSEPFCLDYDGPVVYVIQGEHGGPVKIGYCSRATGVPSRLAGIQTGNPYKLVVRRVIPVENRQAEADMHERLAKYRLVGEWFMDTGYVAMVTGVAVPKPMDEGRKVEPLIDSAYNAGLVAGQREAERNNRRLMQEVADVLGQWCSDPEADEASWSSAEGAFKAMCRASGIGYPAAFRPRAAHAEDEIPLRSAA